VSHLPPHGIGGPVQWRQLARIPPDIGWRAQGLTPESYTMGNKVGHIAVGQCRPHVCCEAESPTGGEDIRDVSDEDFPGYVPFKLVSTPVLTRPPGAASTQMAGNSANATATTAVVTAPKSSLANGPRVQSIRWSSAPRPQASHLSYSPPASFNPPPAATASTAGGSHALPTRSIDVMRSTLPVAAVQDSCKKLSGSVSALRSVSPSSRASGKKSQQSPPQSPKCRSRGMSPMCTPVPSSRCDDEGHDLFWTPRTPPQPVPPAGMLKDDDEAWAGRRPKAFGNNLDGTGTSARQLSSSRRRRSSMSDAAGPSDSYSPMCQRTSTCAQSPEDQPSAGCRLSSAGNSPHGSSLTISATSTSKSRKEGAGTVSFAIPVPVRSVSGRVGQQDPSRRKSATQSAATKALGSTTSGDASGNGGPLSTRLVSVPNTVAGSSSSVVRFVTLPMQTHANEGE